MLEAGPLHTRVHCVLDGPIDIQAIQQPQPNIIFNCFHLCFSDIQDNETGSQARTGQAIQAAIDACTQKTLRVPNMMGSASLECPHLPGHLAEVR